MSVMSSQFSLQFFVSIYQRLFLPRFCLPWHISFNSDSVNPRFMEVMYVCMQCCLSFLIGQYFFAFFCLISIWFLFSDQAIKINSLNIERAYQFQLSVKIWARYTEWFRRNYLLSLKNSKLYKECVGSLTFLSPSNFADFNGCYFRCSCLQRAKNCTLKLFK